MLPLCDDIPHNPPDSAVFLITLGDCKSEITSKIILSWDISLYSRGIKRRNAKGGKGGEKGSAVVSMEESGCPA
jgi:hypothetical protein